MNTDSTVITVEENNNDLINQMLRIAYKAVPKKCSLDGNKLMEVHNELGELIKEKLANQQSVKPTVDEDELDKLADEATMKFLPGCAKNIMAFITHKKFWKEGYKASHSIKTI